MRIFHICDRFEETNKASLERKALVQDSWNDLYERQELIPAHMWDCNYPRNSRDEIGDTRRLPFVRDLFMQGMRQCGDDDVLLHTNDDNAISPELPEMVRFMCSVFGPCSIFRTECRSGLPSIKTPPRQLAAQSNERHVGRDGFALPKRWLVENWDKIQDSICSASMWDVHLACQIRLHYGIVTTNANIFDTIHPAEIPSGFLLHIAHRSAWLDNQDNIPSNRHNGELFKKFAAEYLPQLKVSKHGNLA